MIPDAFLLEDDDPPNLSLSSNTVVDLEGGSFEEVRVDPTKPKQESGSLEWALLVLRGHRCFLRLILLWCCCHVLHFVFSFFHFLQAVM